MIVVAHVSWFVDFTHAVRTVAVSTFYLAMIVALLWMACGVLEHRLSDNERRREAERAARWKRAVARRNVVHLRDVQRQGDTQ